jgi:hypothetical protein
MIKIIRENYHIIYLYPIIIVDLLKFGGKMEFYIWIGLLSHL